MKKLFSILLIVITLVLTGCEGFDFNMFSITSTEKTLESTVDNGDNNSTNDKNSNNPISTNNSQNIVSNDGLILVSIDLSLPGMNPIDIYVKPGSILSDILKNNGFDTVLYHDGLTFKYWVVDGVSCPNPYDKVINNDSKVVATWTDYVKGELVTVHISEYHFDYSVDMDYEVDNNTNLLDFLYDNSILFEEDFIDEKFESLYASNIGFKTTEKNELSQYLIKDLGEGYIDIQVLYSTLDHKYKTGRFIYQGSYYGDVEGMVHINRGDKYYFNSMYIDENSKYVGFNLHTSELVNLHDLYILANGTTYRISPRSIAAYYHYLDNNNSIEFENSYYNDSELDFLIDLEKIGLANYSGTIDFCLEVPNKDTLFIKSAVSEVVEAKVIKLYCNPYDENDYKEIYYYNGAIGNDGLEYPVEDFIIDYMYTDTGFQTTEFSELRQYYDEIQYIKCVFKSLYINYNDFLAYKPTTIYNDSTYENIEGYAIKLRDEVDRSRITSIVIPDRIDGVDGLKPVISIADENGFYECNNLVSVILPDSILRIGNSAFRSCTSLKNIKLPENLLSIGAFAFHGCDMLEDIELPDNISMIEFDTFSYCDNLRNIKIPNKLMSIEPSAFKACTSLESLELNDGLLYISDESFLWCSNLKTIYIPNTIEFIGSSAFEGLESLNTINFGGTEAEWNYLISNVYVGDLTNVKINFYNQVSDKVTNLLYNLETCNYDEFRIEQYTNYSKLIVNKNLFGGDEWFYYMKPIHTTIQNIKEIAFKAEIKNDYSKDIILKIESIKDRKAFEVSVQYDNGRIDFVWDLTQYNDIESSLSEGFTFYMFLLPGEGNGEAEIDVYQLEIITK